MEVSPPGPWQVAGGRKNRCCFTLAPVTMDASVTSAATAAGVGPTSLPTSDIAAGFKDQMVHNFVDDEVYHECIMAGYSSEEAREFVLDKMKSASFKDEHLVEKFWSEVGFPKGTRWWENECSSVGRQPEHRQCASSAPSSSPQCSTKRCSSQINTRVDSNLEKKAL